MTKEKIKKYFPLVVSAEIFREFFISFLHYIKHAGIYNKKKLTKNQIIGKIIADYHVIEKGLTMPETRLGFGSDKILKLCNLCNVFLDLGYSKETQFNHALEVLNEYLDFHKKSYFELSESIIKAITQIISRANSESISQQTVISGNDYFEYSKSDFFEFSASRKSIRNYSNENINPKTIELAIKLAQNAPSSCNRQGSRIHLINNKNEVCKLLEIQGGNRGFGHLADKLIIVTAEIGASHGVYEKNLAYVDGGIFVMNLLYSLHYYGIAACPLNCYMSSSKENKIKNSAKIPSSERLVIMISCGKPAKNLKLAYSKRYKINEVLSSK